MGALEDLLLAPPAGSRPTSLEQLLMPPQNPLAPPEWLARPTRGIAEALGNLLAMPKRAMEQGITTEQAIPWGADVAMAMVGTPGTPAGALGSSLKGARAYQSAPDSLMGFRRSGPNVGFEESRYPFTQKVEVTLPSGEKFFDEMKGLNKSHAIERAHRNWEGSEIKAIE